MFDIVDAVGFGGMRPSLRDNGAPGGGPDAGVVSSRNCAAVPALPVMPAVRFRILGPVRVEPGRVHAACLNRRQARCLLAVLLLETGQVVGMDRLADLLWDGRPPVAAAAAIRCHVARIRAVLSATGVGDLRGHRSGYELRVDPLLVDVHQFTALLEVAEQETDLVRRHWLLRHGLSLWRGPALAGTASDLLWHRLGADVEELRLYAVEEAAGTSLALGHVGRAIAESTRLVADYPYRERVVALHMLALHRAGRTAEALAVFRSARARLADDLGLDPGLMLQRAHRAVLSGDWPDDPLRI